MLLLPRQSVARSAKVNWSRKYPPRSTASRVSLGVDGRRVVDEVTRRPLGLDQRDLLGAGRGGHDGDERQAEEAREVRLGDGSRAGRGLDDRRPLDDPAIADAVQEQRAREPVLERSRRVDRLVLQVQIDVPVLGQRKGVQMRVGRPVGIGFDPPDGLVRPRSRSETLAAVPGRRHVRSFPDSVARWSQAPRAVPSARCMRGIAMDRLTGHGRRLDSPRGSLPPGAHRPPSRG